MRDFKKYSRPKVTKYPKFGDVGVKLKYGSSVFVKVRDFLNVKKFFKVNSIYGEEPTISYGVKALYKTLNKELIVSVDTYESNKDKLLFIEYIGEQQDGPSLEEGLLLCIYDITDINNTTILYNINAGSGSGSGDGEKSIFSSIIIDGVTLSENSYYLFDTLGEHTVLFTLIDSTNINEKLFDHISNLKSIVISNSVTNISSSAFFNCYGLTSIDIPNGVTSIDTAAFSGCSGLTSVTIPNSVTSIGSGAFASCSSLTSIIIPDSVTSIDESTFESCISLTSITIPNSIMIIGDSAFASCTSLTSISIPNSVASIGSYAFHNCSNLTSIICNATTAPKITNFTFNNIANNGWLSVPFGSISSYSNWTSNDAHYLGYYGWNILTIDNGAGSGSGSGSGDGSESESGNYIDEHEYVEIGGVKWATMNIGANSVTDTGLYFQWGDTQGYTASQVGSGEGQKQFGWYDYKYTNDGGSTFTKYNSTDGKMVLEPTDDAVQANWGGNWRMPTTAEFAALGNAIDYIDANGNVITATDKRTTLSGVTGLYVAAKTDHSKRLFFPAAGYCYWGNVDGVDGVGSMGNYWSSSLYSSKVQYSFGLGFGRSNVRWHDDIARYYGNAVRGVCD